MIFRLQREWLALPASLFREVTLPSPVHKIPHLSDQILLGLTNIRGDLHLCVSLTNLLHLEAAPVSINQPDVGLDTGLIYPRMVVIEQDGQAWGFPVDELEGLHQFQQSELRPVPTSISQASDTYTTKLIS